MLGYDLEDLNIMMDSLEEVIQIEESSQTPSISDRNLGGLKTSLSFLQGLWAEGYFDYCIIIIGNVMTFQDTFTVFAELPQYIIEKRERRIFMTKSSVFLEYMKLHLISLNQDWEDTKNGAPLKDDEYDPSDDYFQGAIEATEHLLSVATDIMNSTNERV